MVSSIGPIVPDAMAFGDAAVTGVIAPLPALYAPAFMLGACGYADTLNLCAGYYCEERPADDIEKLLLDIRDMLVKATLKELETDGIVHRGENAVK